MTHDGGEHTAVVVAVAVLALVVFHMLGQAIACQGRPCALHRLFWRRIAGWLVLGVIPAAVAAGSDGWSLVACRFDLRLSRVGAVLSAAAICLVLLSLKRALRQTSASQDDRALPSARWSLGVWLGNAMTWSVYLFGYEYLFRGFVQLGLAHELGAGRSAAIATLLYLLAHVPGPRSELLGALVMAPVFAGLAHLDQSMLGSFLVHLSIALGHDHYVARHARHLPAGPRVGSAKPSAVFDARANVSV